MQAVAEHDATAQGDSRVVLHDDTGQKVHAGMEVSDIPLHVPPEDLGSSHDNRHELQRANSGSMQAVAEHDATAQGDSRVVLHHDTGQKVHAGIKLSASPFHVAHQNRRSGTVNRH